MRILTGSNFTLDYEPGFGRFMLRQGLEYVALTLPQANDIAEAIHAAATNGVQEEVKP